MKAAATFTLSILVVALVPAGLAIASKVAQDMEVDLGVVDGRLVRCSPRPNCVCSEYEGMDAVVEPFSFTGDPETAWERLVELLKAFPRVEIVSATAPYAHAIFRSSLFHFPDDVEFRLDPEAKVIHVRSASRIGRSDLGANRERVEALRVRWDAR